MVKAVILREWRLRSGLTQEQVASAIGIAQSYYYELEAGKKQPSLKIFQKIAELTGLDVDKLMEMFSRSSIDEHKSYCGGSEFEKH